jgi:hypothetical protein
MNQLTTRPLSRSLWSGQGATDYAYPCTLALTSFPRKPATRRLNGDRLRKVHPVMNTSPPNWRICCNNENNEIRLVSYSVCQLILMIWHRLCKLCRGGLNILASGLHSASWNNLHGHQWQN